MKENRNIEYLKPVKILYKSKNVSNEEALLINEYSQTAFNHDNMMKCVGRGYVVLDFGKELCGGIRIMHNFKPHQKKDLKVRIRFGESVGECFNKSRSFQSCKDAIIEIPTLSDLRFGDTGFRFVRIDFIDNKEYNIPQIYAVSYTNKYELKGSFECDDKLINDIFNSSSYTLSLCMQNYIWDGVKRDRLVWVGDMDPEIRALSYLYGDIPIVDETLTEAEKQYKLPSWFGTIPIYNAWYLQIVFDYYLKTGNKEFVLKRIDYINNIIDMFNKCIKDDGSVNCNNIEAKFRGYFIDWPTYRLHDESREAYSTVLLYIFRNVSSLFDLLKLRNNNINNIISKLNNKKEYEFTQKQFISFSVLNGNNKNELFNKLTDNGVNGMTCYLSYYYLSALSKFDINLAINYMKEFYGSMLNLGATTFFEEHDISWVENSSPITRLNKRGEKDYHRDHGIECYKGYRESLCHGWSVGPIQFLIDNVVGLKVLEPGFKKIEIKPNLGSLKYIKTNIATPYGILYISISNNNGDIKIETNNIKEIEIVQS